MNEVRKNLKIDWYRCPIPADRLKELTKRSDLQGWFQAVGHLVLIAATAVTTHLMFVNQQWLLFGLALWVHGIIYTFVPGLVTHELSHATVFKTKSLNEFFLRLYSLLGWVNFHWYKRSHTYHHMFTLHPEGDREVVLPGRPSLSVRRLIQLFTVDFETMWRTISNTFRLAFAGRFAREWDEAVFADDPAGKRKAVNWARLVLAFHLSMFVIGFALQIWMLPVVVSLGTFVGAWWKYFIGVTMHTGLRDNVADWRKCARTIKLDPFSRFIYWQMNFHAEHHMYGAVPCYNLRKLSKEIAWDMPQPRSLIEAWKEMRYVYRRQQTDPSFQFDTPVPQHDSPVSGNKDALGAALGDLAPDSIR